MKNLILTIAFLFSTMLAFSQSEFNFVGMGFYYIDFTNPKSEMSYLLQNGPKSESAIWSDGFNHFEIHLDEKTFTHRYSGGEEGVKTVSKITNIVKTSDYVKFDVKTKDFGTLTCMVSLNDKSNYEFIVKYKNGNNTELAFY